MEQKHGVAPAVATEALRDPWRVVLDPDPSGTSGFGIRGIGETATGRLLTVIVIRESGFTYGVNGWEANDRDAKLYREINEGKKP